MISYFHERGKDSMNHDYFKLNGRVFVTGTSGTREVQDDPKISNKLKLENLTERLFSEILLNYSSKIFDLKMSLNAKREQLKHAKERSSKKVRNVIIAACAASPFVGASLMFLAAYSAGVMDILYDTVEAFLFSSTTLLGTGGISACIIAAIRICIVPDYIGAKREVQTLEEEIPALEQEISDKQQEYAVLQEKSRAQEAPALETPKELKSLKDYNEILEERIIERFSQIRELEEARKVLTELFGTDELESFLTDMGFTSEEAASAKVELEKRFTIQQIKPQQTDQQ